MPKRPHLSQAEKRDARKSKRAAWRAEHVAGKGLKPRPHQPHAPRPVHKGGHKRPVV